MRRPTISPDAVAQDQVRAFVDRILRLKEEGRAITGDIKEVYAEAKGNGFDKTQLGKLVNYIEKRSADGAAVAEGEALFDLYLSAYDGVRASHAHAREGDSSTAALKEEPQVDRPVPEVPETASRVGDSPAGEMSGTGEGGTQRAAETPAGTQAPPVETHTPPAEGNTPTSAGHGDRGAVVPSAASVVVSNVLHLRTHNPETHFLNSDGLPRLHGCLKADRCAGTWRALCFDCSRLHDGPTAQPGAA